MCIHPFQAQELLPSMIAKHYLLLQFGIVSVALLWRRKALHVARNVQTTDTAMIKWCLYLRHRSSKVHEMIRQSGCINLPSQHTLRDYSNSVVSGADFSVSVDRQLMQTAGLASCKTWEKLVVLLLDEMYIREDLVYEKQTGKLIGFTTLGT